MALDQALAFPLSMYHGLKTTIFDTPTQASFALAQNYWTYSPFLAPTVFHIEPLQTIAGDTTFLSQMCDIATSHG